MALFVTTYGSEALDYIAIHKQTIKDTAQVLGISPAALAGLMAKEREAYESRLTFHMYWDGYTALNLPTHAAITAAFEDAKARGIADAGDWVSKVLHPVLMDVGPGNFKFSTALRLLEEYNAAFPDSDPLDLKGYNSDYHLLLSDLLDGSSATTAIFFGLMAKEANIFFTTNLNTVADQAYWNSLSPEFKDALRITYMNFGQTKMWEKYTEQIRTYGFYRPELGVLRDNAGGESYYYYNVAAVRNALGLPDPGTGVPLPIALPTGTPPVRGVVATQSEFQRGLTEAAMEWFRKVRDPGGTKFLDAVTGGIKADLGLIPLQVPSIRGFSQLSSAVRKAVAGDVKSAAALELGRRSVWYLHADDAQGMTVAGADDKNDLMLGGVLADNLSGGGADDLLLGGGEGDTLEGGAGNDTLVGGLGDDQLRGGVGFDRYVVGRGRDTINDADRSGVIETAEGKRIAGFFVRRPDGSYGALIDPALVATKSGDTVTITLANGAQVVIENFGTDPLGLSLTDNVATAPEPDRTILGDLTPTSGEDELGNLNVDPNSPAPDRADVLNGSDISTESDLIQSKGGDDVVAAKKGDDKIEAGTGSDIVNAGEGNDLVLGGADLDLLWGMAGNDRLYADAEVDLQTAIAQGETDLPTGSKGELMDGGEGEDILVGGPGNDALVGGGGSGANVILGGAGDDLILGHVRITSAAREWTVTRTVQQGAGGTQYLWGFNNATAEQDSTPSDDALYGGQGTDWIFGGPGNDLLDGGSGEDVLFGAEGADVLVGGAERDILVGEQGDDFLSGNAGDDTLEGDAGSDFLDGGVGNDFLAGDGDFILAAEHGDDYLQGGAADDQLMGGTGADWVEGGSGRDVLRGDPVGDPGAADVLVGGGAWCLRGLGPGRVPAGARCPHENRRPLGLRPSSPPGYRLVSKRIREFGVPAWGPGAIGV